MIDSLPPGMILILGSLFLPLLRGRLRQATLLLLPVLSALHLIFFLPAGTRIEWECFGYSLTPIHVDRLSLVWGYIFHIAGLCQRALCLACEGFGSARVGFCVCRRGDWSGVCGAT